MSSQPARAPQDAFDPFRQGELADAVPSTEAQREVFAAADWSADASCAFNESFVLRLKGELDTHALGAAFKELQLRHEALRSAFSPDGTMVCVHAAAQAAMTPADLTGISGRAQEAALDVLVREQVETPFDLVRGPLVRAQLVRLGAMNHALVFCAHHLVCDGWSTAIVVKDLAKIYTATRRGRKAELEPAARYSDYAIWERAHLVSAEARADEDYWVALFKGDVPTLDLPTDRPRPPVKTYRSRREDHELPASLVTRLKALGARNGASYFTVLLASFDAFMHRLTGEESVVVGVPSAGQSVKGEDTLVGHCVNLLPIRMNVDARAPFVDLLKKATTTILDAYDHQQMTYGSILRRLEVARDPSRLPLVSVMINLDQGLAEKDLVFEDVEVGFHTTPRSFENFELFVNVIEISGRTYVECQYNSDLFDAETVKNRLAGWQCLLESIADQPDLAVDQLRIVPAAELALQLTTWNGTLRAKPAEATLHRMIAAQAGRTPQKHAVVAGDETLTYRELEARANRIAHRLRALGVTEGGMVGLALDRTIDLLPGLLGILKAGAAYVPVDSAYPRERLLAMFEDASMQALVTTAKVQASLPAQTARVLRLDADAAELAREPDAPPVAAGRHDSPAYVIFTSGSTGRPKGVVVPHGAVTNFLGSMRTEPGMAESDVLLAVTTVSFDIHVLELFLPLVTGATVVVATRDDALDDKALARHIDKHAVTVMQATPATWRMLLTSGWAGSPKLKVLCGGEALPRDLVRQLLPKIGALWNMYGPTETTVWSTCWRVLSADGPLLVGRPIANTTCYVLDQRMTPVPVGVAGELFIGGEGVSQGYLAREDLTKERFVPDPWSQRPGARLYRTGDLARFMRSGEIECLGRNDHQVKLRGFRIELGEIETAVQRFPGVEQCVAGVREKAPGDPRLVAWIKARGAGGVAVSELRKSLRGGLPEYMIPQVFCEVEAMPLTPNGKVDRKRLPMPFGAGAVEAGTAERYVAPSTPTETLVTEAYAKALGLTRVSAVANFFDLGGDEAAAEKVAAALGVQARQLFAAPVPSKLAAMIDKGASTGPVVAARADGGAPLSLMQERILDLESRAKGTSLFNLPTAFRIFGTLDPSSLERALKALVARHEALRTSFHGKRQQVQPEATLNVLRLDLTGDGKEARESRLTADFQRIAEEPFDLSRAPLFRASIYRLSAEEHVLFMMAHHAIWDGWSFDIFVRELSALYDAYASGREPDLPPLAMQYGDFAAWHLKSIEGGALAAPLSYWKEQLSQLGAPLALKTDKPRPASLTFKGRSAPYQVSRELADAVTAVGREAGATFFMVLLTAYKLLLHRKTGQTDLVVATPVRGRTEPAFEHVIGSFVNYVALRTRIDPEESFVDLLRRVRTTALEGLSRDQTPLELVIRELGAGSDPARTPLAQAYFSFQDARSRSQSFGRLPFAQINIEPTTCPTDLNLWVKEDHKGLAGSLNYASDLFEPSTAARLLEELNELLATIVSAPRAKVGALAAGDGGDAATAARVRGWIAAIPRVEEALKGIDALQAVAVTIQFAPGSVPRLAAFYSLKAGELVTATDLRRRVREKVGEDALPHAFVELETLDKTKLPAAFKVVDDDRGTPPSTPSEKLLAGVWCELLGIDDVSTQGNFFELGGHSLLAIQMINRVEQATGVKLNRLAVTLNTLGQIAATMGPPPESSLPAAEGSLEAAKSAQQALPEADQPKGLSRLWRKLVPK